MIRRAKFQDVPAIERLIRNQHARSKYAGRCGISDKALNATVMGAVAQMNQPGPQGSHVAVAVRDGKVTGVIIGCFDRIYHIGDKLSANDIFLINEGRSAGDTMALVDSYIEWARANRRCLEVLLSWSDALPGAERISELYRRKGAVKTGELWEIALDGPALEVAA